MKFKQRIFALLCAGALLLCLAPHGTAAESEVLFLALNDQMITPLTADIMPISYNGTVYVPYSVFDGHLGVDLGIYTSLDKSTLTLFNKQRALYYNLDAGTCLDKDGNKYARAVVRGGILYLPVSSVRTFFAEDGLGYSSLATEYGSIIRLTAPGFVLSNDYFRDAALAQLPDILHKYHQSQSPGAEPSPGPSVLPVTPAEPGDTPTPDKRNVRVYLAVSCTDGTALTSLLDTLQKANLSALFFFRPEDLAPNEGAIRRMVGLGHAVGLTLSGDRAEDAKAQLAEGNRLLQMIAHTSTHTVTLEQENAAGRAALEAEGWSVWSANVSAAAPAPSAHSAALMREIDARRSVARVALDDSAHSAATLPYLLRALDAENYTIRLAVGSEVS